MFEFTLTYTDGHGCCVSDVERITYHDEELIEVLPSEFLTHHFPLNMDIRLFSSDRNSVLSHTQLRAIEVAEY